MKLTPRKSHLGARWPSCGCGRLSAQADDLHTLLVWRVGPSGAGYALPTEARAIRELGLLNARPEVVEGLLWMHVLAQVHAHVHAYVHAHVHVHGPSDDSLTSPEPTPDKLL